MKTTSLAGLVWVLTTLSATAWDSTGHMLVAQIAHVRLSAKAAARVDALAAQLDNRGTPYNAVTLACWADDIKDKTSPSPFRGQFKPWHYIDLGCRPAARDALNHPVALTATNGDLVTALNHCVALIKHKQTDALVPSAAVALALLLHFSGDAHQPLHTTARFNPHPKPDDKDNNDAGGNAVTLANLADTPWGKNLHTFWDESYRRYYQNGEVKALPELSEATAANSPEMKEWLQQLESVAPKAEVRVDIKQWILETHKIGCAQVYGTLGAPYGAKNVILTEKYVTDAAHTARRQLVLAGYRLAALLDELYGD